jgi:septal ring factor EnvC (AmiA/AmiB activator)
MRAAYPFRPCWILLVVLLVAAMAAPAAQAGTTDKQAAAQKKLAAVKQRIAALAREQRHTGEKRDAVNAQLAHQADQLAQAARAVRDSDAALTANQHKLDALEDRRATLKAGLEGQREALAQLLRAAYMIEPGSDLRLLLGDADLSRLTRALAYSRYFQHERVQRIRTLLGKLDQWRQLHGAIVAQRDKLKTTKATRKQHIQKLGAARKKQQALLTQVDAAITDQHQRMRQLEHNRKSLEALLKKLRDVFADIPKVLPSDTPFASLRGKLPWPVQGKAERQREGLHIRAARGTKVRAVAHGRIAYANWLRGYGLLVIIDHGNGWMSLYGGNESVLASAGDWVNAGQPIATAGASASDDAGVYFGLRHHGKAVNPLPWLGARH